MSDQVEQTHGWLRASEAYQAHRMAITGTVANLLETSNLPVYSVWEDMKELMIRAAAELSKANAENARLRVENEQLSERVKAAEGWHG